MKKKSFFTSIYFNILLCMIFPQFIWGLLYYSKKMNYFLRSLISLIDIPVGLLYALWYDFLLNYLKNSIFENGIIQNMTITITIGFTITFGLLFFLFFVYKGIAEIFRKRSQNNFYHELETLNIENYSIVNKLLETPQHLKTASNSFSLSDVINQFSNQQNTTIRVLKTQIHEKNYVCQIEISFITDYYKLIKYPICAICMFSQDEMELKLNTLVVPLKRNRKLPLKRINEQILNEVIKFTKIKTTFDKDFEFLDD